MLGNLFSHGCLAPAVVFVSLAASFSGVEAASRSKNARRSVELNTRQTDYSDISHCPGGSIGDADTCTFEPTTIYDTSIKRWTQYGSWYDNCASTDTASITDTLSSSVAVTNSLTETTTISVGIDADGFTAGASESFAQTWSTTDTFTESQAITVGPQQNGDIQISKMFIMSEGTLKINYGSAQDGHYIWLTTGIEVFSADPSSSDTYSANVADCGVVSAPNPAAWYYEDADYDSVVASSSSTYTYSDDS